LNGAAQIHALADIETNQRRERRFALFLLSSDTRRELRLAIRKVKCNGISTYFIVWIVMTSKSLDKPELPDGFEFGIVESDEDLDELTEFITGIHNELIAKYQRRLIENMPGFGREMNFYIRDADKGAIVSSLSAIPSVWEYDGIPLRNLEIEFVATKESYRRRGFVRVLYSHFEKELHRGEYHISSLWGMPYFFRQFGYDFLFPISFMGAGFTLRADQIPRLTQDEVPSYMSLSVRPATQDDIKEIIRLHDAISSRLLVRTARSRNLWEIQERLRKQRSFDFETMVVEQDGRVDGYFRYVAHGEESSMVAHLGVSMLDVIETSISSYDGVMCVLQFLREMAVSQNLQLIVLPGTKACNLSRVGIDLGAQPKEWWRYQIRIPDMALLLKQIAPALVQHLKGTMFERLTQDVTLHTYDNCYALNFVDGDIVDVKDMGTQSWGNLSARPHDLVRLIFGESDIEELNRMNADFLVSGSDKALFETLFPKRESHIFYYLC